jgi:hypothetical protein
LHLRHTMFRGKIEPLSSLTNVISECSDLPPVHAIKMEGSQTRQQEEIEGEG